MNACAATNFCSNATDVISLLHALLRGFAQPGWLPSTRRLARSVVFEAIDLEREIDSISEDNFAPTEVTDLENGIAPLLFQNGRRRDSSLPLAPNT